MYLVALSCLTLCNPVGVACQAPLSGDSLNTGVGSISLLQGIFPTQGWNPGLPHCRWILYCLSPQEHAGNCCQCVPPIARMGPAQSHCLWFKVWGRHVQFELLCHVPCLPAREAGTWNLAFVVFIGGEMKFCFLQCNSPTTERQILLGTAKGNGKVLWVLACAHM